MSTIRHPIQNHTWWYAAATAVLIGLLALLVTHLFWVSSGSEGNSPGHSVTHTGVQSFHGQMFREVCFAHRPGQPLELAGPGCMAP